MKTYEGFLNVMPLSSLVIVIAENEKLVNNLNLIDVHVWAA